MRWGFFFVISIQLFSWHSHCCWFSPSLPPDTLPGPCLGSSYDLEFFLLWRLYPVLPSSAHNIVLLLYNILLNNTIIQYWIILYYSFCHTTIYLLHLFFCLWADLLALHLLLVSLWTLSNLGLMTQHVNPSLVFIFHFQVPLSLQHICLTIPIPGSIWPSVFLHPDHW